MFKLFIFVLIFILAQGQEPQRIELLKRFQVTINETNTLKYFFVDIDEALTEKDELIIQSGQGDRKIHYYIQKERKPTPDDHFGTGYLIDHQYVIRRESDVKRLYFGFYTRSKEPTSQIALLFKAKIQKTPLRSDQGPITLEIKKGFIGLFSVFRPFVHDYVLTVKWFEDSPKELFSTFSLSSFPNEIRNPNSLRLNKGVNVFTNRMESNLYGIYADKDLKIELFYSHKLSYLRYGGNYRLKKLKLIEHYSLVPHSPKAIALFGKGKEMKFYLNHAQNERNLQNPTENKHDLIGKQYFGLSGYWGSIIEADKFYKYIRLGIDKGEVDTEIGLYTDYNSNIIPTGNHIPIITTITSAKGLRYNYDSNDFNQFFKFDVSLQKKSKVKLTQISHGRTKEIINTDQDFNITISLENNHSYVWMIEGDNTIMIRSGQYYDF